ncbi:hypothetical protein LTR27_005969 [Elasticomyces elasticus]|nr:hypothetical protein LTR27_005969 [Elasticomyces elasticus]
MNLLSFTLVLSFALLSVVTLVWQLYTPALSNEFESHHQQQLWTRQSSVASGVDLRVLPLGDSITFGFQSTDKNGYRLALYNDLQESGRDVDFIGSVNSGTMADNANEGHSGFTIDGIAGVIRGSLLRRPNVVLLHAGTNDMNDVPPDDPYDGAPAGLAALIDEVLCTCPDAVIMVAQIIQSSTPATEGRIKTYDAAIPGVVAKRFAQGFKVMTVDMSSIGGSDLFDTLHPNDGGYVKMATLWYQALQGVPSEWFTKPEPAESACGLALECAVDSIFWYGANNAKPIASGVGSGGDGKFKNNWVSIGEVASGLGHNGTGVMFGDLDGDGKDEYLWVNQITGSMIGYYNKYGGSATWIPINDGKTIASGVGTGAGVRIADLDGDGKDDYLFVHTDGSVDAYINKGATSSGWAWKEVLKIATGVAGATQQTVIFADIDGDGRADYVVKHDDGGLDVYLNIGAYGSVDNIVWQPYLKAAGGLGNPNITLADLDGDGRADYLIFDQDGGLSGYTNIRGKSEGQPVWISQGGAKSIASGLAPPNRVRTADLNGDGKADYLIINDTSGAVSAYLNNGNADNEVKGDGIRIADLDGDGVDDYIAVNAQGAVIAYKNGGASSNSQGWVWFPQNNGDFIATGIGNIHFADINGDGKADYLAVDDETGAVTMYTNGGPKDDGWLWISEGVVASGLGEGAGVRFAGINGDCRADYIWLSKGGAATVYINQPGDKVANWVALNEGQPIASGIGAMRRDVHFADVNGDGSGSISRVHIGRPTLLIVPFYLGADYLWVHPVLGSVDLYINGGANSGAPGGWVWLPQGNIASGIGFSGPSVTFGRIGTSGRADYVAVDPASGALTVYLNGCSKPEKRSADASSSCGKPPLPPNTSTAPGTTGTGGGGTTAPTGSSTDVYINPTIWSSATPVVSCIPPCVYILPSYSWSTDTTLTFPPWTTTFTADWKATTTTSVIVVTFPPITTNELPVYNINITRPGLDSQTFAVTPSVQLTTVLTIPPPPGITEPPLTITGISTLPDDTTPGATTTPVIKDRPTKVSHTSTNPPGPTCTGNCHRGTKCHLLFLCNDCDFGICKHHCLFCPGTDNPDGGGGGGGDPGSDPTKTPDPTDPTSTCATPIVTSSCDVTCETAPTSTCATYCQLTTGCDAEGTTTTTTVSSDAYVIPTAVYDDYNTDIDSNQDVLSYVAAGMSAENSIDTEPTPSTSPTTFQPSTSTVHITPPGTTTVVFITTTSQPSQPTCVPKTVAGDGGFYLFSSSTVGSGCDIGDPAGCTKWYWYENIVPVGDWNCAHLGDIKLNEDTPWPPIDYGDTTYPTSFDFDPLGKCEANTLHFELQCDGSYYVTAQDQGGEAVCKIGDGTDDACVEGFNTFEYVQRLECYGTICHPGD